MPGGTFNHFARTAGAASVDLANDALQRGEGVRADVAELAFGDDEPITVLNTASVDIYPDFVAEREQREQQLAPLQRRHLDGGMLDIRLLHAGSRVRAIASLAFGRRTSAVVRALGLPPRRIERLRAESIDVVVRPREGQPPGFAHDGEVAMEALAEATAAYPPTGLPHEDYDRTGGSRRVPSGPWAPGEE